MNRPAIYSYLTRYPYGHSGSDRLSTVPLPDSNISGKIRCWTRQKLTDNYGMLVYLLPDNLGGASTSLEGMSFPSLGDFAAFPSLGTSTPVLVYHHRVRCDGKSTLVISFRLMVCHHCLLCNQVMVYHHIASVTVYHHTTAPR